MPEEFSMRRSAAIMVAIRDLDSSSAPLVSKGAQLAKALKTSVRLLNVIPIPYVPVTSGAAMARQLVREQVTDSEEKLKKLARAPSLRGLQVDVTSRHRSPWCAR
jgi:hypothetical protein